MLWPFTKIAHFRHSAWTWHQKGHKSIAFSQFFLEYPCKKILAQVTHYQNHILWKQHINWIWPTLGELLALQVAHTYIPLQFFNKMAQKIILLMYFQRRLHLCFWSDLSRFDLLTHLVLFMSSYVSYISRWSLSN